MNLAQSELERCISEFSLWSAIALTGILIDKATYTLYGLSADDISLLEDRVARLTIKLAV